MHTQTFISNPSEANLPNYPYLFLSYRARDAHEEDSITNHKAHFFSTQKMLSRSRIKPFANTLSPITLAILQETRVSP